jgi:hypothetical protein
LSTCVGIKSISPTPCCTYAGPKQGTQATHPIIGDEMRALRKLQQEQDPKSPFVFTTGIAVH